MGDGGWEMGDGEFIINYAFREVDSCETPTQNFLSNA